MIGLLSAEFLKLRKRLMPRVLLCILLALTVLVFSCLDSIARQHAMNAEAAGGPVVVGQYR